MSSATSESVSSARRADVSVWEKCENKRLPKLSDAMTQAGAKLGACIGAGGSCSVYQVTLGDRKLLYKIPHAMWDDPMITTQKKTVEIWEGFACEKANLAALQGRKIRFMPKPVEDPVLQSFPGIWMEDRSLKSLRSTPASGKPLMIWFSHFLRLAEFFHDMQREGVLHGDIKEANICANLETQETQVIDFGLVRSVGEEKGSGDLYTIDHRPPEFVFLNEKLSCSLDWWAWGMTFFSLFTRRSPFFKLWEEENVLQTKAEYLGILIDFLGSDVVTPWLKKHNIQIKAIKPDQLVTDWKTTLMKHYPDWAAEKLIAILTPLLCLENRDGPREVAAIVRATFEHTCFRSIRQTSDLSHIKIQLVGSSVPVSFPSYTIALPAKEIYLPKLNQQGGHVQLLAGDKSVNLLELPQDYDVEVGVSQEGKLIVKLISLRKAKDEVKK